MRLLMFLTFFILAGTSWGKDVYFGKGAVNVSVPFYDDNGDMISEPTVFIFHKDVYSVREKSKFVIVPEDKNNPDHRRLNIIPMVRSGRQTVFFTLSDQSTLKVNINVIRKKNVRDVEIRFLPRATLRAKSPNRSKMTDFDFIKAMIGGQKIIGGSTVKSKSTVRCGSWNVSGKLIKTEKLGDTKGYTIEFKNTSKTYTYQFDDTKIFFKNQDLSRSPIIHLSGDVLGIKGSGDSKVTMRIVTGGSTSISDGRVCKLGEQLIAIPPVKKPPTKKKSLPKVKLKKLAKRGKK